MSDKLRKTVHLNEMIIYAFLVYDVINVNEMFINKYYVELTELIFILHVQMSLPK